jgi:hypothetical protein
MNLEEATALVESRFKRVVQFDQDQPRYDQTPTGLIYQTFASGFHKPEGEMTDPLAFHRDPADAIATLAKWMDGRPSSQRRVLWWRTRPLLENWGCARMEFNNATMRGEIKRRQERWVTYWRCAAEE